jgi:hypothetical protein
MSTESRGGAGMGASSDMTAQARPCDSTVLSFRRRGDGSPRTGCIAWSDSGDHPPGNGGLGWEIGAT